MNKPSEKTLGERITDYLASGGLFNPELMEHEKVRDLLLDCRDALDQLDTQRSQCGEWRVEKEDGFVWIRSVSEAITNTVAYTLAMPTLLQSVCDAHNATLRPEPRKEAK